MDLGPLGGHYQVLSFQKWAWGAAHSILPFVWFLHSFRAVSVLWPYTDYFCSTNVTLWFRGYNEGYGGRPFKPNSKTLFRFLLKPKRKRKTEDFLLVCFIPQEQRAAFTICNSSWLTLYYIYKQFFPFMSMAHFGPPCPTEKFPNVPEVYPYVHNSAY